MRTIMETANHPAVGVTWNSNTSDVLYGSVAEYFQLLRPWIRSCHINELHSGYPYRELFRLLREMGYRSRHPGGDCRHARRGHRRTPDALLQSALDRTLRRPGVLTTTAEFPRLPLPSCLVTHGRQRRRQRR